MASKVNFLLVEHLSVEIKQSGGLDGWNRHHFSAERGPSGAGNTRGGSESFEALIKGGGEA